MELKTVELDTFPEGSNLGATTGYYGTSTLSIWGDTLAFVDGPSYYDIKYPGENSFNPATLSRKYVVFKTNLPPNKDWVGREVHWKHGDRKFWETSFSFSTGFGYSRNFVEGTVEKPVIYWIKVRKYSDLSPGETAMVERYLQSNGYVEVRKYQLSAAKWKRLLKKSFAESQEGDDYDLCNAADEVGEHVWDNVAGVYALTKKGSIKFVVKKAA